MGPFVESGSLDRDVENKSVGGCVHAYSIDSALYIDGRQYSDELGLSHALTRVSATCAVGRWFPTPKMDPFFVLCTTDGGGRQRHIPGSILPCHMGASRTVAHRSTIVSKGLFLVANE